MKKYCVFFLSILLANASPFGAKAFAQLEVPDGFWKSTGPAVRGIAINSLWADSRKPNYVFAESDGALLRSTDAGIVWNRIATPMNAIARPLLAANGMLYVEVDNNGIFFSPVAGTISWRQAPAPLNDKTVNQLLQHNGRLFAGTATAGVFYSDDAGASWTQTGAPLSDRPILKIVALNETLFAATGYPRINGLFKSTDAGLSWIEATFPAAGELFTTANGMLFIGDGAGHSETQGIWQSTDGGNTWVQTQKGLGITKIFQGIYAAGNRLFASLLRDPWDTTDNTQSFLVSADGGSSWSPGALNYVIDIISANGITIAVTARDGIFLSYDNGTNWLSANAPLDAVNGNGVAAIRSVGRTLYASVLDKKSRHLGGDFWEPGGVYISTDNGRNWAKTTQGLTDNIGIFDLEVDLSYILAIGEGGTGIENLQTFRSDDNGLNWLNINSNIAEYVKLEEAGRDNVHVYAEGGALFLTSLSDRTLIRSTDGGVNWQPTGVGYVLSMASAGGVLYGGITDGVLRSIDGGVSWTGTNFPVSSPVNSLLFSNGTIYAGTREAGIFFRADEAKSWTRANPPLNTGSITHLIATNNTVVAGMENGVYYSIDKGLNWTQSNSPWQNAAVTAFFFTNGRLFASAGDAFFSDDGGVTWTQADTPIGSVDNMLAIADRVYAATKNGVYWTAANDGIKWYPLKTGLGNRHVVELGYLPVNTLFYAATDSGVFLQKLDTTAPLADTLFIDNNAAFTDTVNVDLILLASNADSMTVSENIDFNGASWEGQNSFRSFTLSNGDGRKTVYAKFKDISFNQSAVLSAQITLDKTNPDFSKFPHSPPPTAAPGRAIRITQQVDESNLSSFELFFRRVGEVFDRNARKISFVNNTAIIDSERVNNKGLDYQISATDKAGRSTTLQNGALDFFSIPVNVNATALGNSPSLPSGTGGAAYRIVSMPLDLPNASPVKNIFKDLGKYGRRGKWRFYSYQGNGQWQEGENLSMQTGAGYFIIRRDGGSLTNIISGATAKTTDGVLGNIAGWKLRAGDWTLIGNPYNTRIELNQLKLKRKDTRLSDHGVDVQVYNYDGQWKNSLTEPELALEIWGGLFVRVANADTIVFADTKEPYARSARKAGIVAANLAEGEWSVQITAANGEFSDEVNYFGVKKEAKDEMDNWDWYEPPFLPDGVGLSFPHVEWNDPTELTADFRSIAGDGHRWEIVVKGEPAHAVQLSFTNIETVPEDLQVLLVDETTQIVRDLRKEPAFSIRIPATGTKTLAIIAGNDFFINKHTEGMLGVPTTFALQQNYPNPFNPSTTVRYQLPVAGRVTLKIFDIMGREVLLLEENKSREPGYYEMVADMSALGSGVYFYRIAVAGEQKFQATKKMLFVK